MGGLRAPLQLTASIVRARPRFNTSSYHARHSSQALPCNPYRRWWTGLGKGGSNYLVRPSLGLLPFYGRVHFLVLSWSNNCYLGFQSAVLVAIRAA